MAWAVGHKLQGGKYIIEQVLGQGGFGITYRARHTLLNQLMVIKTPNESQKHDPEYFKYVRRFIEEGRRLEKLSQKPHSHIVRIRDLFEENGTYCLVMDFVPGESLFQMVYRRGALPEAEAVDYARQIGQALSAVHQADLVHRDAHPGNIMVQDDGRAVLIDFGIAGEIVPVTISSQLFANPAFAPYEQIGGSREPTVDIYSLAACLYYAVTGQLPTSSLERKLNNAPLLPPKRLNRSISDDLNWAILKGMELEAQNRPQSMQQWLKLLEPTGIVMGYAIPEIEPDTNPASELPTDSVWQMKTRRSPQRRTSTKHWGWMVGVVLSYSALGWLLAPLDGGRVVAVAVAVAVAADWAADWAAAWAVAWAAAWAVAVAGAWVGSVAGVWTGDWVVAVAVTGAWSWVVVVAVAVAVGQASLKLLQYFSRFHTFLILTGTSWLGLWLGWWMHQMFG